MLLSDNLLKDLLKLYCDYTNITPPPEIMRWRIRDEDLLGISLFLIFEINKLLLMDTTSLAMSLFCMRLVQRKQRNSFCKIPSRL